MKDLSKSLHKAVLRRCGLSAVTDAMRLVNGAGDGLPGLLIDRYQKHFHVQVLSGHWQKELPGIQRFLSSLMPLEYMIVKTRHGLEFEKAVLLGGDSRTVVQEHGLKFAVDLDDGLNCGLFLDMRKNRRMLSRQCRDKKVLNCFSYTCSFGLHARAGGASQVVNIDISRKILGRGKNNYLLNGLSFAAGEFIRDDAAVFLQKASKKGHSFDVVILDPPSFARNEKGTFQVKRDLPRLVALSAAVLNPKGNLLVVTNYSALSYTDLEKMVEQGVTGRRIEQCQRVGQDIDFAGTNTFKESHMVGLWVKFP